MLLEVVVAVIAAVSATMLYFLTRSYSYWKAKGVVYIPPKFPFGIAHSQFFGNADPGTYSRQFYTQYKAQGLKFVGAFTIQQPTLFVLDLDLLRHIMAKDFQHFVSRDMIPTSHEYISKHLFALKGQEWRDMRAKLTPTFTSGKIKNMFPLMMKCAEQMVSHIDEFVLQKGEFEVKDLIARFTTDIIATCAFGLEINCIKNRDDEFFTIGQLIFIPNPAIVVKMFMQWNFPTVSKILDLKLFDPRISKLVSKLMEDTVQYRKNNNVYRDDFVDLLLRVKDKKTELEENCNELETRTETVYNNTTYFKASEKNITSETAVKGALTMQEMTAQAFVFFAAGLETASSTTSFCLFELAKNREIQEILRQEIDKVLADHGGDMCYQALQDMTYLEQVVCETLRMYPSLPVVNRVCTEAYQIPGTDVVIDEGVRVHIPTFAIHHDPELYPDPFTFDPDRFSEENCRERHPYAYIPFGEGPRMCIGMRFGKQQMKIGLTSILSRYEVLPASDTPPRIELDPFIPITAARRPFRLKIAKRKDI